MDIFCEVFLCSMQYLDVRGLALRSESGLDKMAPWCHVFHWGQSLFYVFFTLCNFESMLLYISAVWNLAAAPPKNRQEYFKEGGR